MPESTQNGLAYLDGKTNEYYQVGLLSEAEAARQHIKWYTELDSISLKRNIEAVKKYDEERTARLNRSYDLIKEVCEDNNDLDIKAINYLQSRTNSELSDFIVSYNEYGETYLYSVLGLQSRLHSHK